MQFINIVVHSVENMNFRVHLQYEFTQHGLDDLLEASLTFNLLSHFGNLQKTTFFFITQFGLFFFFFGRAEVKVHGE